MATFTSGPHQSPASSLPPFSLKQANTVTWGAGGNSTTITDEYIHPNSAPFVWVTGGTPAIGTNWSYSIVQGSMTITSTDAENSALTLSYILL